MRLSVQFPIPKSLLIFQTATLLSPNTRPNTSSLYPIVTPCDPSLLLSISLNPDGIRHHFRNYPDPTVPQLLSDISQFGVRVGYEGPSKKSKSFDLIIGQQQSLYLSSMNTSLKNLRPEEFKKSRFSHHLIIHLLLV